MNSTGTVIEGRGKTLGELMAPSPERAGFCVRLDNTLRELDYVIPDDERHTAVLLDCNDPEAMKVYEGSLRYLAGMALERIRPDLKVIISYAVSRSLFLRFEKRNNGELVVADVKLKKALLYEMRTIVKADYPIAKKTVGKYEALKLYAKLGAADRIEALSYRPEETVHLYFCDGYIDYPYCYMVPTMGALSHFRLTLMKPGMVLSYPRYDAGGKIPPLDPDHSYARALRKNLEWAQCAGLDTIAKVNKTLAEYGAVTLTSMCEAYIDRQMSLLGESIQKRGRKLKLICIAGPSSSGKTTFAKRLKTYLMSLGMRPIRISLDDYYLPKSRIPVGSDGKRDLESIKALDIARFDADISSLASGKPTRLPQYDFTTGNGDSFRTVTLPKGEPVIVEGIHALSPDLDPEIAREEKFGIFISPQAQVSIDDHNPMSLTDTRLIRRIVRDSLTRNTSAAETITMWPAVRRGEFEHIYPSEGNADFVFNSYLSYEMCALKRLAVPLLEQVDSNSPAAITAARLLKFLKYFPAMKTEFIPCDSLLREFIGGSSYAD